MASAPGRPSTPEVMAEGNSPTIPSGSELTPGSRPSAKRTWPCMRCGVASFVSRSALHKHSQTCGQRDRTACRFCDKTFTSYASVCLHECKSHPAERNALLVAAGHSLSIAEQMEIIARIEAAAIKGAPFVAEMASATGLTKDMVRHRRISKEYPDYLRRAKEALKESAKRRFSLPAAATSARTSPSSSPTNPRVSALRGSPAPPTPGSPSSPNPFKGLVKPRVATPPPSGHQVPAGKALAPVFSPASRKRRRTSSPPSETPAPAVNPTPVLDGPATPVPSTSAEPLGEPPPSQAPPLKRRMCDAPASPAAARPLADASRGRVVVHSNILLPEPVVFAFPSSPPAPLQTPVLAPASAPPITPVQPDSVPQATTSLPSAPPPPPPPLPVPHPTPALPPSLLSGSIGTFLQSVLGSESTTASTAAFIRTALYGSDDEVRASMSWVRSIFPAQARAPRGRRGPARQRNYNERAPARGARAARYKKAQDLFQKNRRALADTIFEGRPLLEDEIFPSVPDVEALYAGVFEESSPPDEDPISDQRPKADDDLPHITSDEVASMKKGWKPSAPGLDRVSVHAVLAADNTLLAVAYNAILLRCIFPAEWSSLRTTLIPKKGNRADPTNWRPITVSSAIQRLFHRIVASRLTSATSLSRHQRGFIRADGTLISSLLLDHYISSRTKAGKSLNVVMTDISRAFDTVSHSSISRALQRFGISAPLRAYIESSLRGSTTVLRVGRADTRPINIMRGTKQGDPMSPVLFNMVVDELLCMFDNTPRGGTVAEGVRVPALAFADDLVLMEDNEVEVPAALDLTEVFFRRRGMALCPRKTVCYSAARVGGVSVPRTRSFLKIGGRGISMLNSSICFKYLGHNFSTSGISKPSLTNLSSWVANLMSAPLKPQQKLALVKGFLIPRVLYGLQNPQMSAALLKDADKIIKSAVKRFLHFNIHTPDPCIYAKERDGGLGILQLRLDIPRIFVGRLERVRENADPEDAALKALLATQYFERLSARIHSLAGSTPAAQVWREAIAAGSFTRGLEGVAEDPASRTWLGNVPRGWTGRDFVRAVQSRTNNLPCLGIPSNPAEQRRCRGCRQRQETLSHILQRCGVVDGARRQRHNEIVGKLSRHCRYKGWTVEEEPHVRHTSGRLFKPDLAIHRDGKVIICDVQVSWEGDTPLEQAWQNKRAVYDCPQFREAAALKWGNRPLLFVPAVIGARGVWPRANEPTQEALDIPPSVRASCVHSALKWASTIHQRFMRSVWA